MSKAPSPSATEEKWLQDKINGAVTEALKKQAGEVQNQQVQNHQVQGLSGDHAEEWLRQNQEAKKEMRAEWAQFLKGVEVGSTKSKIHEDKDLAYFAFCQGFRQAIQAHGYECGCSSPVCQ